MARSSDIVVIGAGIIGCAVARELAGRGAAVAVLDSGPPGAGATQASGGMLAPFSEAADGNPLLALGVRSLALFDDFVASLEAETDIPVGYHRTGTLHVARDVGTLAELDRLQRALGHWHVDAERLSADEARAHEPNLAPDIAGGLFIREQGLLSAPALTRALVTGARRRGARLLDPAQALRLRRRDGGVAIDTSTGTIEAGTVVLAAGAWSGQIAVDGADQLPVKPVRGQLLHLKWNAAPLARITWDDRVYLVPWDDGTLLVGATVEDAGFAQQATVAGVRGLLEAVCDLCPNAWTADLQSVRVGLRPGSPDPLPVIGWSTVLPGLMYATGHYRNGVLLAPLTARLVAAAVVDERIDADMILTQPERLGRF